MMEIDELIQKIQGRIEDAKEQGYDMEKAQWGKGGYDEEGMVISFNDMQSILKYIDSLKMDLLAANE